MSWQCVVCDNFNTNDRDWCRNCLSSGIRVIRTSTFFCLCEESFLEQYVERLKTRKQSTMTEKEKLFAELFNSEKTLIANMSDLELRAHREELQKIAFEARARVTAVEDEEKTRRGKGKATGFVKNLEPDEIATDAINKIAARQGKLTKQEKLIESMKKLGIDTSDAEKLMQAGVVKARLDAMAAKKKEDFKEDSKENLDIKAPMPSEAEVSKAVNEILASKSEETKSKSFNPFAK